MNETVGVALIAVLGTLLGAGIAPVVGVIRDVAQSRTESRSDRLKVAADFANALVVLGRTGPDEYESWDVARMRSEATDARFELARTLQRGEGNVDRFAEHAITTISAYKDVRRADAARHSASKILDWARGDLAASKLYHFEFIRNGDEYEIV